MKSLIFVSLFAFCISLSGFSVFSSEHWNGEFYSTYSSLQHKWASERIQKLDLKGNETVLDIGSGDGEISLKMANLLPKGKVVGVDPSQSMFDKAQKRIQSSIHQNLAFELKGVSEIEYISQFDQVVSFSAFHWFADPAQALKKISTSLKPDGKLFLYFHPDHGRPRFDWAIRKVMSSPEWKTYFANFKSSYHAYSSEQLAQWIKEAHLLLNRIEIVKVSEKFSDRTAFKKWLSTWMQQLNFIPEKSRDSFLSSIVSEYTATYPQSKSGPFVYVDYFMEVEAEKPSARVQSLLDSAQR